jgi:hypothetical protein
MTVAKETPSSTLTKLSQSERLVRKRIAARLRQQRCRTRKRQSMLEERRQQIQTQPTQHTQDSHTPQSQAYPTSAHFTYDRTPPYGTPRTNEGDCWSDNSSSNGPIKNCVSFDSHRSFEEAQRSYKRVHPTVESPMSRNQAIHVPLVSPVAPPRRPPVDIVSLPAAASPTKNPIAEEEAAVAAMLSLKSGNSEQVKAKLPYRHEPHYRHYEVKPPRVASFRYNREWEGPPVPHFDRHEYSRNVRAPQYHLIPPPPPPRPHYSYYHGFERYETYDYE